MLNTIKQAFLHGQSDPSFGETLVTLIPKNADPKSFAELRPISLCNVIYKLITEIVVGGLRPILCHYISPTQAAFLKVGTPQILLLFFSRSFTEPGRLKLTLVQLSTKLT